MLDIMALFACFSQCLYQTTIRQLCGGAESMLPMTGWMTMRGMARCADKWGSDRTIQRFFHDEPAGGYLAWVLIRHHLLDQDDVLLMGGDEVMGT